MKIYEITNKDNDRIGEGRLRYDQARARIDKVFADAPRNKREVYKKLKDMAGKAAADRLAQAANPVVQAAGRAAAAAIRQRNTASALSKPGIGYGFNIAPGVAARAAIHPLAQKAKATANISGRDWDATGKVDKNLDWNVKFNKDDVPYLGGKGSIEWDSRSGNVGVDYGTDLGGGKLTGSAGYNFKSKDPSFRIGWSKKF